ncbi:aldolase [Hankyongella ginsenosidimutans]|uniref:Aldolase n=1 Tax=Hankyongella ginsenosidimutans TaxID=1763828 RepID=A0A4D7C376_9SPHN|nr:HPr kinase/phosphatase C-terminal domain-containing protein [Hankyongella ginsenosidimutans]QCI79531.1 aldolase [Hankyongella ginsenosidimutans]TXG81229.1 MAG: aldolase [Sphingomonadales bacterium]
METVHASCVAVFGRGVLLLGESGAGKSSLALRLIDRGAMLVGDDRICLHEDGGLFASAPLPLAGLIESRGLGILRLPYRRKARLALAVTLAAAERLPEPECWRWKSQTLPLVRIDANAADAAQKVERALSEYGLSLKSAS